MGIVDWFVISRIADQKTGQLKKEIRSLEKSQENRSAGSLDHLISIGLPPNSRTLLAWKAPFRTVIKVSDPKKLLIPAALATLLTIPIFLLSDFGAAFAFLLIFVALGIYLFFPSPVTEIILTDKGIKRSTLFFPWEVLDNYRFKTIAEKTYLEIKTKTSSNNLEIGLEDADRGKVSRILSGYLALSENNTRTFSNLIVEVFSKLLA